MHMKEVRPKRGVRSLGISNSRAWRGICTIDSSSSSSSHEVIIYSRCSIGRRVKSPFDYVQSTFLYKLHAHVQEDKIVSRLCFDLIFSRTLSSHTNRLAAADEKPKQSADPISQMQVTLIARCYNTRQDERSSQAAEL